MNDSLRTQELSPIEERQSVTFVLLAYNQESYITAAVDSALSQTYDPLVIIISDDCSTDNTFSQIIAATKTYCGPHKLIVRRNEHNLGLIKHVNLVFSQTNTEIIIFAAGDDISEPDRTSKITKAFNSDKDVMLIHSRVTTIDSRGLIIGTQSPPVVSDFPPLTRLWDLMGIYIGATGAIRRNVVAAFGPIQRTGTYEDLILGFRARLLGRLKYLDEPLVKYRLNAGISTEVYRSNLTEKARRIALIDLKLDTLDQRSIDLRAFDNPLSKTLLKKIDAKIKICKAQKILLEDKLLFCRILITRECRFCVGAVILELLSFLKRQVRLTIAHFRK